MIVVGPENIRNLSINSTDPTNRLSVRDDSTIQISENYLLIRIIAIPSTTFTRDCKNTAPPFLVFRAWIEGSDN